MRHAKFKFIGRLSLEKKTAIYSPGSNLCHIILIIYINIYSPFARMLLVKFGFDWPSGRGEDA